MWQTIDELWTNTVAEILQHGKETKSRVGKVKEILRFSASLSHVQQTFLLNKRRRLSPAYAAAEFLWYLSMTGDIEMILAYAPQYHKYAENDVAYGAYGARWKEHDQLRLLVETLKAKPDSRQAIMTMWTGSDLSHAILGDHKDLPCTLNLQFLVRENKLHLVATMRSNDAWLGLPYDVFAFTCLQWLVASVLGIEPGTYTHQVGSMHLYEKNWKAAEEAVEYNYPVSYRRLEHEWNQVTSVHWQSDVDRALLVEQKIRKDPTPKALVFPVNDTLNDCVLCAASKWMDWGQSPKSPILREALKNANAKK